MFFYKDINFDDNMLFCYKKLIKVDLGVKIPDALKVLINKT